MFFIIWREDRFGGFFLMEVEFVVCWSGRVFFIYGGERMF